MRLSSCMTWVAAAAFLFLSLCPARAEAPVVLAADVWCPYTCEKGLGQDGFAVDMAREIFEAAGFEVEYRVMSWRRALSEATNGYIDGVLGADRSEAHWLIYPEEELGSTAGDFFVLKSNPWRYAGTSSLVGVRLALVAGYGIHPDIAEFLQRRGREALVQYTVSQDPLEENLRKLVAGRVDAILDDRTAILYEAEKLGVLDLIEYAGSDDVPANLYVAFSDKSPRSRNLARIWDRGVRKLRASGRLEAILARYGLHDWK